MPNPNEYLAKESLLALKQDKLVAGDNITIDPITNRISAQTGAGTVTDVKVDNVSVVNASGIANVDLSGKQNTLTPGTNITIQNNVISATGGTEVEANPADPATDTLITVDIDGTVYDIAGSGGGTTVVPNPSGTPTDTLSTIQIGNDIFEIEGGGDGGGGYSSTLLWDYVTDNAGTIPYGTYSVTLNDDIENYDILIGEIRSASGDSGVWDNTSQMFIDVNTLINSNNPNRYLYTSFDNRSSGWYISGTTMEKVAEGGGGSCNGLVRVYGLKFGGTAVTETILWTGTIDSIGDAGVLNKPLGDYDYLLTYGDVSGKVGEHHMDCLDARMLKESLDNGDEPYFSYEYYDTQYLRCRFSDETHFSCVEFNNCDFHYTKIVGIKINDASGGGTNVEPNPQEEPTDTLSTIRIGDTVFDIAGSGGGSGSASVDEIIYQSATEETSILMSKPLTDYDYIWVCTKYYDSSAGHDVDITGVFETSRLMDNIGVWNGVTSDSKYIYFTVTDATHLSRVLNNSLYIAEIHGIKFSGGSGGTTSEIIPITAGDGTNSRTFTLRRTPNKVTLQGYTSGDGGWYESAYFIWGEDFMSLVGAQRTMATGGYAGQATISYGADGKSFTITAANAFGAFNRSDNFSGMMLIDYGEGGTSDGSKDISDMTWTPLISQAGGSWSAATAIPSGTTHVALVVDYNNKAYMPQTFKLSDWDKYASVLNHSLVEWGFDWKTGSDYDTVQLEYDSTNKTIKTYAGYNGLTLKTYALS